MASFHRIQTEAWLKTIKLPALSRVLDIGGSQLPIKNRLGEKGEVSIFKILDLEVPHECKQIPDYKCDLNIHIGSNLEIQKIGWEDGKFDIVFCIEVTEYLWNIKTALDNIWYTLKMNGILYITFPFIYMAHKPDGTDFLRYTPTGAEKLLQEAGFEILEHKFRLATSGKLNEFYQEEKMKGLPDFNNDIIGSMIKAKKIKNNL